MEPLKDILEKVGFIQPGNCKPLPTFKDWEIYGGLYVDDLRFCNEVLGEAKTLNVITYTCNADMVNFLPIKKLITNRLSGTLLPSKKKIKFANNVHTKMYIVNDREVWVGSMNLVLPCNWHNVMMKADYNQTESLLLYFKRLWSLASNNPCHSCLTH